MLSLLATLVVLGIVFYLIELIPMASPFPQIIRVVAVLIAIFIVLNAFGVNTYLPLR
jgi:VIT1/CCC1 family predicted Fe2+/Mn2+ transporter